MRFFVGWVSLGAAAAMLNGCFQVGDDDASGGEGGQSGDDGKTGGMTSASGTAGNATGATGGSMGGSPSAGMAGKPQAGRDGGSFIGRGGKTGKGGSSGSGGSGATGGTDARAGSDGSGGNTGGGKGGVGGSAGTGGSANGGSGGTSSPPFTEGVCDDWSKALETCEVVSGSVDCTSPSGGAYQSCWYGCFVDAPCSQVVAGLCTTGASNALVDCIDACNLLTFACEAGETVPGSYECDGAEDCSNGKDEANCPAHTGMFACGNGSYVPSTYRCDDFDDCTNGADEVDCPALTCPLPSAPAPGATCSKAAAQLKSCGLLPGGVMTSCTDFTEQQACEKTCFASASCDTLEAYFCTDGTAGDSITKCADDCSTESDDFPCTADGFAISADWVCDDYPDCSDGSDEAHCSLSCGDGTEVTWLYQCDGTAHCTDGADEAGCMATCPAGG